MRKNVAGQRIGAQLVSATDGSAFTGSVTVSVCGDAGTQATGSVGSGACTHEGGGYHTYAPSQAETNFDLIAFTFSGTGAVPVTIQVYTRPATGLLAPTVADRTLDVSAGGEAGIDWANVGSPTTSLNLSGTTISTSQAVASVSGAVGSVSGAVGSVTGNVGGNVVGSVASIAGVTFPTNFASLAISGAGAVTVGTNGDKTGYSLTQSFPANFASLAITVGGAVTAGTVSDKTGYSLAQAFPSNFASLGINSSGHISRVVLCDTTTTNTDMITAAAIRSAVGLASANLDTQLTTIDDLLDTEVAAIVSSVNTITGHVDTLETEVGKIIKSGESRTVARTGQTSITFTETRA